MGISRTTLINGLQLSLRAAVATGLAVAIAQSLDFEYPLYTVIAGVIVMDLSPRKTVQLARQRLAGTLIGAAVGGVLSYLLPSGPVPVAAAIAVAMLLSHLMLLPGAAKLAGFLSGMVVLAHSAHPWLYARNRTIETLLGVGMAVLVSLVPKLMRLEIPGETETTTPPQR
jgi:uncharacterized membrane protein YgaE (UPF0421/DUF939 family)